LRKRHKKGRSVNGVLLLDKVQGLTSNAALQEVKHLFEAAKAGHTGSLDPLATGALPLCFGEGTKFSQFLLDADKRYLARFKLGISTNSGDADGEIIARNEVAGVDAARVQSLLKEFTGEIEQIPSMFSAIKHKGQPLYKLARQGIEVERKPRKVTIYKLELVEFSDDEFVLDISCSKGTYIRSLAEDLGKRLGCGAHICELRRLSAGPYDVEDAYTFAQLRNIKETEGMQALEKCLMPVSSAVQDWPAITLPETTAYYLKQGQAIQISGAPTEGWVRLFTQEGENKKGFIGVGEIQDDGKVAPRRLLAAG
jgi:tRNA pseudouridine55 synthase